MFLLVASDPVLSHATIPLFDDRVAVATVAASKRTADCPLPLSPLSPSTEGRVSCGLPRSVQRHKLQEHCKLHVGEIQRC